jgi:hypothetical protein
MRRTKLYVQPADTRRRNSPVVIVRPNPTAWAIALRLANGQVSRFDPQPDGSVIVSNKPRRSTS